jgi:beta-phosphoglucomutase-like phosphatase (HAD superfamily)
MATQLLAKKAGKPLPPGQCLVIEDAPVVIRRVRDAGFPVLGVATTYPLPSLAGANYVVSSLEPAEVRRAIPHLQING